MNQFSLACNQAYSLLVLLTAQVILNKKVHFF